MKLRRIESGKYESVDGRVVIERVISYNHRRANDVCWSITVDGYNDGFCEMTKRDAVAVAEKRLNRAR